MKNITQLRFFAYCLKFQYILYLHIIMRKVLLLLSAMLLPAWADASVNIDGIFYNLSNETKTAEVTESDEYIGYVGDIIIPPSVEYGGETYEVTRIGENAFFQDYDLTSLSIPSSVKSIGENALYYCHHLTSLTLSEGLETIEGYSLYYLASLKTLRIPTTVKSVGFSAFGETRLNKLIIPDIAAWCAIDFNNWEANPMKGAQGFYSDENTKVTYLDIPSGVTSIGNYAFNYCKDLQGVTIPSTVESIGKYAFYQTNITEAILPEGLTTIGDGAFKECYSLLKAYIPSTLKNISQEAFRGCVKMKELTLSEGIETISKNAFQSDYGMSSLTIPSTVTSIGDYAFNACYLDKVYCHIETPLNITYYTFLDSYKATLYVPEGCKEAYENASWWDVFKNIIEMLDEVPLTIGEAGVATYASIYDLNFKGVTGMKAYIASGFNPQTGKLLLTQVEEVPAGTGIYVKGAADDYAIPVAETKMYYANLLVGVTEDTTVAPTTDTNTNFILSNGSYGVSFYTLSEEGTIAAGKAYLSLPTSAVEAMANPITLVFDDEEVTGINNTQNSLSGQDEYYTLDGRKLHGKPAQKGIYIHNGKKEVVK